MSDLTGNDLAILGRFDVSVWQSAPDVQLEPRDVEPLVRRGYLICRARKLGRWSMLRLSETGAAALMEGAWR